MGGGRKEELFNGYRVSVPQDKRKIHECALNSAILSSLIVGTDQSVQHSGVLIGVQLMLV